MATARAPLPTEARPGSILAGRFRVERLLGAGGMGAVLEATRVETGQRVAVKLLLEASHPEAAIRFEREAKLAASLESPHVVSVLDFDRTPSGLPFIVMERLEGRDLAELVDEGTPLTIERAVDLVAEACLGVGAAHAAGLVHRDLKPSNLFLARLPGGAELVKVLDFGLSKSLDTLEPALTTTAASFGTPQYMAPEQIQSTKHVDARCDQHALGMILYELLTGQPAFTAETAGAIYVAICTQPAPRAAAQRPEVPPALDDAIGRALSKRPADRFPDLGAFVRALVPFGSARAADAHVELEAMFADAAPTELVRDPEGLASTSPRAARSRSEATTELAAWPPRGRAWVWVGAALAGAAVAAAGIALSGAYQGDATPAAASAAAAPPVALGGPADPVGREASVTPSASATVAVEPRPDTPSASPSAPSPAVKPSTRVVRGPTRPAPSEARPARAPTSDPVEVFGARR